MTDQASPQIKFKYRGPNTFYFKRKKLPLESLKCRMAFLRTIYPGGGGSFNTNTGDGEAWDKNSDCLESGYFRKRKIKAGQWDGWWIRIRNKDVLSL